MNISKIITDRVLPVGVALNMIALIGVTVLFLTKGHIGAAVSTGALAVLFGIVVAHDVRRLLLK